ncbi:complement factor H-like [Diadema setosum]|uniref:complement factor H-like n=1 Tax=Diadema setosum TaxID=31175 RepID=UPI003B3AC664
MEGNQRSPVFTALQLCIWLCCLSGVLAENCTSLEAITFADITYDPPALAGQPDTYQEGTVATTQCDDKYAVFPPASAQRTCVDGSWSGRLGSCRHIGRRCRRDDFFVEYLGQTCTTACANRPRGACPRGKSCICDGVCGWSCVDIDADNFCPELDEASLNIVVTYDPPGRPYNAVATVSCAEEYRYLGGSLTRRCMSSQTWSGRETVCAPQNVCGDLPEVPHGMPAPTNQLYFLPNDRRTYTCGPGYLIRGSVNSVQCNADYTWTEPEFTCSPRSCGYPGRIANMRMVDSVFLYGYTVTYACNPGYENPPDTIPYRTCQANGEWTSNTPTCRRISCPPIDSLAHGTVVNYDDNYEYESRLRFSCDAGYGLQGSANRECEANGAWSGEEAVCVEIICEDLGPPANGMINEGNRREVYRDGDVVYYLCNALFRISGSQSNRCTANGRWAHPLPRCNSIYNDCQRPLLNDIHLNPASFDPPHPSWTDISHGTRVTLTCQRGYELNGVSETVCDDGQYNPPLGSVTCTAKTCVQDILANGKILYRSSLTEGFQSTVILSQGAFRRIKCKEGYTTTGPVRSRCDDGIWIQEQTGAVSSAPRCDPDPCTAIPNENMTVSYGRDPRQDGLYENGTTATAQCDDGYHMAITSETFVCRASRWIPATPKCLLHTNLAIGSTPFQSKQRPTAQLAIDGRTNGHYSGHSCTRIGPSKKPLWWKTDLKATYLVNSIRIFNAFDTEGQLTGAAVRVGSLQNFLENPQCGGNITLQQILQSTPDNHGINITCEDQMTGRYVSIDLPPSSAGSFLLCEVEVFGIGPVRVHGEQSQSPSELEGCTIPQVTNARLVTDRAPGQVILAKPTGGTEEERRNDLRGVVKYRCDDGHAIAGSTVKRHKMTCLNVTGWDSDPPICVPENCTAQPIENGRLLQYEIDDIIPHDSVVRYACNDGYEGPPSDSVECRHGNLFPTVPTCSPASCGVEELDTSNMVVKMSYHHGERMELQCRPGYELSEQVSNLQRPLCENGEWNHTQIPACRKVSCGEPGRSNDITIEDIPQEGVEGYVHGARIRYVCLDGYTMTGNAVRDCLYGQWSGSVPECVAQVFPQHCRLPTASNGEMYSVTGVDHGDDVFGEGVRNQSTVQVSLVCSRSSYAPESIWVSTTCIDGTFTPPVPQCVARFGHCQVPDQVDDVLQFVNGRETQELGSYYDSSLPSGTVLVSRCTHPERFVLLGDTRRTCLRSRWTGSAPSCKESNVQFSFSHTQIQTRSDGTFVIVPNRPVHIDCDTSALNHDDVEIEADIYARHLHARQVFPHYLYGKPLSLIRLTISSPTPQDSGTFTCRSLDPRIHHFHTIHVEFGEYRCSTPSWPAYGRVVDPEGGTGWDSDGYPMTKTMLFECRDGYQVNGANNTTCVLGEWSHPTPRCERVKCRELSTPTNGNMHSEGVDVGDLALFDCDYGYEKRGPELLTCGSDGQWSHEPPTCHEIPPPPSPCDDIECEVWQKCVVDRAGGASCGCISPFDCPEPESGEPQVCGTNAEFYPSLCRLKAVACLSRTGVDVASSPDVCHSGITEAPLDVSESDLGSAGSSFSSNTAYGPTEVISTESSEVPLEFCNIGGCQSVTVQDSCENITAVLIARADGFDVMTGRTPITVNDVLTTDGNPGWNDVREIILVDPIDEEQNCICAVFYIGAYDIMIFRRPLREDGRAELHSSDFVRPYSDDLKEEIMATCFASSTSDAGELVPWFSSVVTEE